jgi:hypothetical protein
MYFFKLVNFNVLSLTPRGNSVMTTTTIDKYSIKTSNQRSRTLLCGVYLY